MTAIVTVNVSLLQAPAPNTLQQSGAFVSSGGTTLAANTLRLLTQMSDLTPILRPERAVASLAWAGGTVTATTTAPHGMTIGQVITLDLEGQTPTAYAGPFNCTITGASTFTYPLASDPGPNTVPGTWEPYDKYELLAMATTFFAQGIAQSVYVLELGLVNDVTAIATLTTWLANNPNTIYSFLMPRWWVTSSALLTLVRNNSTPTSKLYFWLCIAANGQQNIWLTLKSAVVLLEAPAVNRIASPTVTEFTMAAPFYHSLAYRPSPTNRVPPFAFTYCFGVTPYPTQGNGSLLATLKSQGVNVIATGAEGGISNTMVEWGTTMDIRDFTYWYGIDYTQIHAAENLANEVINGSNNVTNPLYYDQPGINRLQARLAQQMSAEISYGIAEGTIVQTEMDTLDFANALDTGQFTDKVVINAVPFVPYVTANPSDFRAGIYRGLTIVYIPKRGFLQITLNIVASDFITV